MPEKGTLVVGRTREDTDRFIAILVNLRTGRILESSEELDEAAIRKLLKEKYDETDQQIEARLKLAREHPPV